MLHRRGPSTVGMLLLAATIIALIWVVLYFKVPSTRMRQLSLELAGSKLTLSQSVSRGTILVRPPAWAGDRPVCAPEEGASPPERGKAQEGQSSPTDQTDTVGITQ